RRPARLAGEILRRQGEERLRVVEIARGEDGPKLGGATRPHGAFGGSVLAGSNLGGFGGCILGRRAHGCRVIGGWVLVSRVRGCWALGQPRRGRRRLVGPSLGGGHGLLVGLLFRLARNAPPPRVSGQE